MNASKQKMCFHKFKLNYHQIGRSYRIFFYACKYGCGYTKKIKYRKLLNKFWIKGE